jgi:copper chaperone CopZ
MTTKEYKIDGMSCQHCVKTVEKKLSEVELESSNVRIGLAKITFNENETSEKQIIRAINNTGYKVVN